MEREAIGAVKVCEMVGNASPDDVKSQARDALNSGP
jgi:hypothetical protein